MIDFNAGGSHTTPVISPAANLNFPRLYPIPVMLPDGKLMLFDGTTGVVNTNFILDCEVYDPAAGTWQVMPPQKAGGSYHGVGLLTADGRMYIAGSTPDRVNWETRSEWYHPPYWFSNNRPVINGRVSTAPYGGLIRIPTPNQTEITKVSLVRLGASTHHFDPNMRLVWLPVENRESTAVIVRAPLNGTIASPGDYYIHLLNSENIPSIAQVIRIPGTMC